MWDFRGRHIRSSNLATLWALFSTISLAWSAEYAVLQAETPDSTQQFCMIYYPEFKTLPSSPELAIPEELYNATRFDGCLPLGIKFESYATLTLATNNCPIEKTIVNYKLARAVSLIMATTKGKVDDLIIDANETSSVNMTVGFVSENTGKTLLNLLERTKGRVRVRMYSDYKMPFDYSLIVIWAVAIFTVGVGSYWSGMVRLDLYNRETGRYVGNGGVDARYGGGGHCDKMGSTGSQTDSYEEESSLDVSPLLVSLFVVCMGAMLLLLYFFFQYLVYFIIGMFALASVTSLIGVLEPIVQRIPIGVTRIPKRWCPCFYGSLEVRQYLLIAFSIGVTVVWLLCRHMPWSWALQDVLGVAFSINMLKTLRLPNLMICAVLLILLFFYDIFFVFITPFLTMKGESVMVEVAKGAGTSQEQLPMVLRVPHLGSDPLSVCFMQFSLLGFGDILVPGLLVSYCHGFDLIHNTKRIYFYITTFFYGVGLVVTFIALYLMKTPQPALLYLVPCTLIPVIFIALCRGELGAMWRGAPKVPHHIPPVSPPMLPPYGATENDPSPLYPPHQTEEVLIGP